MRLVWCDGMLHVTRYTSNVTRDLPAASTSPTPHASRCLHPKRHIYSRINVTFLHALMSHIFTFIHTSRALTHPMRIRPLLLCCPGGGAGKRELS